MVPNRFKLATLETEFDNSGKDCLIPNLIQSVASSLLTLRSTAFCKTTGIYYAVGCAAQRGYTNRVRGRVPCAASSSSFFIARFSARVAGAAAQD